MQYVIRDEHYLISFAATVERANGCVVKGLAPRLRGHRFDSRVHRIFD